jgi:hypothetical protein
MSAVGGSKKEAERLAADAMLARHADAAPDAPSEPKP